MALLCYNKAKVIHSEKKEKREKNKYSLNVLAC